MITMTYRPEWDVIALDKVSIGCDIGGTPKHDFTKQYYDNLWWWRRKFETLMRLQDEFIPHEKSGSFYY